MPSITPCKEGFRAGQASALAIVSQKPRDLQMARDALNRLRAFNLMEVLVAYVDRLGPMDRLPIPLLQTIASNFSAINDQQRALKYLDEAYRGDPDYPPTLLSRAQVLMYLGRESESHKDLERCLRKAPEIAQAHWLQAQLGKQSAGSNHVPELRSWLTRAKARVDDRVFLGFALHKELDDLGEYEAAWQALEQACAAKRGTLRYRKEDSRELVDALVGMRLPDSPPSLPEPSGRTPVFIVGMHRSGTTLLEQLLDAHPRVRGIGELYDFTSAMRYATDHHCQGVIDRTIVARAPQVDFAEVGRRYLNGLAWRLGAETHFTDKLPSNFLNIGFICHALPHAKILHMVRDPVETCFSNLRELFSNANPYSYDQGELADFFLQYRRLMVHWHRAYPGRILDVDYARLTADPESTMREVAAFCGLDYVDGMRSTASSTRAVATASAIQVRGEVVRRERPKWAPYATWLQPLIRALPDA